jgi:hypothetical protein
MAEQALEEIKQNPHVSAEDLYQEVVRGGLACEMTYLQRVARSIREALEGVEIPADEIEATRRHVRSESIYRIWREKGFDRDGRRLRIPVEPGALGGLGLRPDAQAIAGQLGLRKQIDDLREQIANRLAAKPSIGEGDSRDPPPLRKRGRPKQHPLTANYEFHLELLKAMNAHPEMTKVGARVNKDHLPRLANVDTSQLWWYEEMNGYLPNGHLSESIYKRIHDRLRRPVDDLVREFLDQERSRSK